MTKRINMSAPHPHGGHDSNRTPRWPIILAGATFAAIWSGAVDPDVLEAHGMESFRVALSSLGPLVDGLWDYVNTLS